MQIATLSYQYDPKENVNGDSRAKLRHRRVLTTLTNPQKKYKHRQSFLSSVSTNSTIPLPPIARNGKRPSSIRIKGSSLPSSKLGESSAVSFNHQSRSHSRLSNKSEISGVKSRSVSPGGPFRSASKLIRLKFGYPIKLRSADFYGPDRSETELRIREESFVNDSIRSAHESRRSSIIPHYEPLDDPHLRQFFQSPIVLDVVRKTLNADPNSSYKLDEKLSKASKKKKESRTSANLDDDYHKIVSKGSSGYSKLNGYDCIPSYSPPRHHRHGSITADRTTTSSQRWNTIKSGLLHSTSQNKYQASANTSVTSFPTDSTNQLQQQQKKKKYRKHEKFKSIATSSPLKHSLRHLPETQTTNIETSSTIKSAGNAQQRSEFAVASSVSQD